MTEDEMVAWHHQVNGRPGMLQSMGLQRVRQDLVTEQQQQHNLQTKGMVLGSSGYKHRLWVGFNSLNRLWMGSSMTQLIW